MLINNKMDFFDEEKRGIIIGKTPVLIGGNREKGNVVIEAPCAFLGGGSIDVGRIGAYTYVTGNSNFRFVDSIGRFCMIADDVCIGFPEHNYRNITAHAIFDLPNGNLFGDYYSYQNSKENNYNLIRKNMKENRNYKKDKYIIIGNDVWIGHGAIILRGVEIGDGAVIGAGAVVACDVPAYSIVSGNPARVVKYRFSDEIINRLIAVKWWDYGPEILKDVDITKIPEALEEIENRTQYMKKYSAVEWQFDLSEHKILKKLSEK